MVVLPVPLAPDDPDDAAWRQGERQVIVQQLVAEGLHHTRRPR